MTEQEMLERILYKDSLVLVMNKPAGLPVHGGPGGGDNFEQYFYHLQFGLPNPPGLGHRLDRDTSGCLVLGRHRKALKKLGKLFSSGRVDKTYWALVRGTPETPEGIIDAPLAKQTNQKNKWWMKVDSEGQMAVTTYRILASNGDYTWLSLSPQTGRTHQIRVHCAHIGCPLVGDFAYNPHFVQGDTLALHARSITLPLYPSRDPVHVDAPAPPAFETLLERYLPAARAQLVQLMVEQPR